MDKEKYAGLLTRLRESVMLSRKDEERQILRQLIAEYPDGQWELQNFLPKLWQEIDNNNNLVGVPGTVWTPMTTEPYTPPYDVGVGQGVYVYKSIHPQLGNSIWQASGQDGVWDVLLRDVNSGYGVDVSSATGRPIVTVSEIVGPGASIYYKETNEWKPLDVGGNTVNTLVDISGPNEAGTIWGISQVNGDEDWGNPCSWDPGTGWSVQGAAKVWRVSAGSENPESVCFVGTDERGIFRWDRGTLTNFAIPTPATDVGVGLLGHVWATTAATLSPNTPGVVFYTGDGWPSVAGPVDPTNIAVDETGLAFLCTSFGWLYRRS